MGEQHAGEAQLPTGAFHASELQHLFEASYFSGRTLAPDQARLSDTMIGYWSRFARHGDPNGPGAPAWRPAEPGRDTVLRLVPGPRGIGPVDLCRAHRCGFWGAHRQPEGGAG
ncbi:carboxylesterase family protein [Nonomuraea sp. NPDC050328]|uniref:carboxylesterase family protein n=1 Tax=Nonomuraea sp. NPDC050328 TaxID=3364361 RepID=UPI0037BD9E7F